MDFTLLQQEIKRLHPEYKIVTLCRFMKPGIPAKLRYCFHMLRQMYHLATAETVILDSYAILVSILRHKKTLLVIQMWHSVGTMKKFGYSILDMPEGSSSKIAHAMGMHKNYDYILCAGEGYRTHLAEGFNYPEEKIVILPLPRVEQLNDTDFWQKKRASMCAKYPALEARKNILYVPTFRKSPSEKADFEKAADLLRKAFRPYEAQYNLIMKPHPLSNIPSDYEEYSSFDLIAVADFVISDYSCVIYEAAIRHIPLYFYTYDYESYTASRAIYMDYPNEIPSKMHSDPAALMADLTSGSYDMERHEAFLRKYVAYDQPQITANIVDFIWTHRK